MAYAAVASLSESIDIILKYHQDYTAPEFQNQITSLQNHSLFLQSFIEEFPDRGNNWDETIREVTDRAEEIVELSLSDSWLESKSSIESDELERVIEEMESIINRLKGGRRMEAMDGYDHDLMQIIRRLREGSSEIETIGIVGMGGIGKTTLARNAYNHPSIVEHFDIRAWSVISLEYSRRGIMSELLRCMKAEGSLSDSEDDMIVSVRKNLYGRRYLIVLDDIWSSMAWDRLMVMFPDDGNGSRIILTTRIPHLCRDIGDMYYHLMQFLDEKTSWNMLREKIFKGDPCPSQLEHVGKMIVRGCRGHPLSIAVVSGILAADQTEAAWKDISENIWNNIRFDYIHVSNILNPIAYKVYDRALNILSLSHTYLPHHLRPCFLYLAIFPEDHEIHVSKLVKLWVAEGFLNESEYQSSEEMGEERVEDLVRRSLVSVTKRKSNGRIKSIAVHDLMRDLCLIQAEKDNFIFQVREYYPHIEAVGVGLQSYRRVSISTNNDDDDILEDVYGSTIRTIILSLYDSRLSVKLLGNVRLLRILDLSNSNYEYDLPEAVFDLFHLRFLAFHSGFSISKAISNLENLQTLIICPRDNDDGVFVKLPGGVWGMPQLRHLIVFPFELPSPKGVTTSALENLQTLSRVVDFVCSRENLKMIPNLKKIALLYTQKLRDEKEDPELHNLIYLQKLEILKIEMDWSFEQEHKMSTHFAFPPTLKKLNLCGVQLAWEDMKIVASLPNLHVLKLRKHACIGETWETSEAGFSQLTYLLIEESNLKNWITKSICHFPRLKCLVLRSCLRLLQVPNDIGKIPTLELIELDNQNHSLLSSADRIQKDRQSLGYDHLQIRLV